MKERRASKYFWHNMKLFTSIFYGICVVVALIFLWSESKNQQEKTLMRYQSSAESCAAELDNRMNNIRKLITEISGITWVKKLSTSSEVFLKEFTELEKLECEAELRRYFATDESISDIAVYVPEKGIVLSQQGWFTEKEYKISLSNRCDIDCDAVLAQARQRCNAFYFGDMPYNVENRRHVVLINSLVDVKSPTASLILILNRDKFNQKMTKLAGSGDMTAIQVLNLAGEPVFSTAAENPEGYRLDIPSGEFPVTYRITFPEATGLLNRYSILSSAFFPVLLTMLLIAALLSYLLSMYNAKPLQNLVGKISDMSGEMADPLKGETEFEQIENSFYSLCSQQRDLEESLKENSSLAKRYALMLLLYGDKKLTGMSFPYFEALEIPFREDMVYFVWVILQKTEPEKKISILELFAELQPQTEAVEEIQVLPGQTVLIVGQKPEEPALNCEEIAEWIRLLVMERQNILLEVKIEKTDGAGTAGISQAYHRLIAPAEDGESAASREDMRGREIVAYINQNYCDPDISLKALGDRWKLSTPTVSRLCREAAGVSFLTYLTSLRLQKAKEILLETKDTPAHVAIAVGYTSEYSFRRAFQRSENCKLQDWIARNRAASSSEAPGEDQEGDFMEASQEDCEERYQ